MTRNAGPPRIGRRYADLVVIVGLVAGFDLVVVVGALSGLDGTPLRLLFGLPFLLVVPGYAVIAALYPVTAPTADPSGLHDGSTAIPLPSGNAITTVERLALSVATSIAVVAGVGLLANFSPWGVRPAPVVAGTTVVTLGAVAVAAHRRAAAPRRTRRRGREWRWRSVASALRPRPSVTYLLNVLLVASVVAAAVAVGYTAADPSSGEQFTEFAVLAENDAGEPVAGGYPTEFTRGQGEPLYFRIDNHEGRPMQYTVVVRLEAVETTGGSTTVTRATELDRLDVRVGDGGSRTLEYTVRPTTSGERLRLSVLLYRGGAPSSPERSSAYRALHLWISVSE